VLLNNNLALCYFRLKEYRKSIDCCNHALAIDRSNAKALFRRAKSRAQIGDFQEALADLEQADQLGAPKAEVQSERTEIHMQSREVEQKQRQQFANVIQKLAEQPRPKSPPKLVKCRLCDEMLEEVQLARHVIKKHSSK